MQEQRAHEQPAGFGDFTNDGCLLTRPICDLNCIEFAVQMRTGNNFQRTIVRMAIVKMQADSDHTFQNFTWRLHVKNSVFD